MKKLIVFYYKLIIIHLTIIVLSKKCKNCDEIFENWVCLICGDLFCSRYINSHFISHNLEKTDHNICLSLMDLSFWCYSCESYIINKVKLNFNKRN
jgi:uncharacterized UBP type Zn finger protein